MQNSQLCYRQNIVYKFQCLLCNQFYIGSTIQCLHDRIREHTIQNRSSIYKHLHLYKIEKLLHNQNYNIEILAEAKDTVTLRITEGLLISQLKPEINAKHETEDLTTITEFVT